MENVSNMLISKIVVTEDSNLTNAHQVHELEEIHFETKHRMECENVILSERFFP